MNVKEKIWAWPDGLVWKIAERFTYKSRRKKYDFFMQILQPHSNDSILDVGVSPFIGRYTNFLEIWYPFPERITALTIGAEDKFQNFREHFPKINLIFADGEKINFPDNSFDIVFSNAVIEHTGSRDRQKQFIHEILRVGKRAFITTPCYWFPVDSHTLIPFAHYIYPLKYRFKIYSFFGREYYADLNHLNLLKPKEFLTLFPNKTKVKLFKQKCFGIVSALIAVVEK